MSATSPGTDADPSPESGAGTGFDLDDGIGDELAQAGDLIDPPVDEDQPGDPTAYDELTEDVPGQGQLGPVVERFDEVVDAAFERIRGNPVADRTFQAASTVGDFSAIWHATNIGIALVRRPRRARERVITFAVLIGLESLVVNQGVKRIVRRTRPTAAGDDGLRVRHPRTSSFPSGHASAATFAAALLGARAGRPAARAIAATAAVVAVSRAYVRIHHASDVVAGVVTGGILVASTRAVMRRLGLARLL
ncbi:phosphatase PAP2 family protein [Ilumatobacter sp.]|uniref:phosphatase PAP2 family protein n=1 Tax=Ilumatobacter sp. TaxID=1967498 RepID=UPI003B529722